MAFRRLLEAECGQSNPIEQLSSHVTNQQAQQETIAHPFISGRTQDNSMAPQSFRMEDLIHEMRSIESDMDSVPLTLSIDHFSSVTSTNEFSPQMAEENYRDAQEPLLNDWYENRQNIDNFDHHSEFPRTYGLPFPQEFQQIMTYEEFLKSQKEIKQSQKAFWETLDNSIEQIESESPEETKEKIMDSSKEESEEENVDSSKEESEEENVDSSKEESEEENMDSSKEESEDTTSSTTLLPMICWDGLWIVDEMQVADLSLYENNPKWFIQFEKVYVNQYCKDRGIPNIIQNPTTSIPNMLKDLKPYECIKENPMLGDSTALEVGENAYNDGNVDEAILCFDAAVQQDPYNLYNWAKLCKAWFRQNELEEALCVANQMLKLEPENIWAHLCIAKIYAARNCRYQECQYIFNWLRYNELYADIVPPSFEMQDKATTELDNDTLKKVTKMFKLAAQRTCYNPDAKVQMCLARLCHLSGENEKISDCLRLVSNLDPKSSETKNAKCKLSIRSFHDNKPEEALRICLELSLTKKKKYLIYRRIGFIYMYLKNYEKAAYYLTESLKEKYPNTYDIKLKKDFARLYLCLELYHKAYWRDNGVNYFDQTFPQFAKSFCDKHFKNSIW